MSSDNQYESLDVEEGEIMNNIFHRRMIMNNGNIVIAIVGFTGSGKTYTGIRMAELWYKKYFKKKYPKENICFDVLSFLKRLRSEDVGPGDILIYEEAAKSLNSLDFQNNIVKVFNAVMGTFRKKRVSVIVTLPYFSMLNKQSRMLVNMLIKTIDIDRAKKISIVKPLWLSWDQETGKMWKERPKKLINGYYEIIDFLHYGLADSKLLFEYEMMKDTFVGNTIDESIAHAEKASLKSYGQLQIFTDNQKNMYDMYHHRKMTGKKNAVIVKEISSELKVTESSVYECWRAMERRMPSWKDREYDPKAGKTKPKPLQITDS